MTISVIVITWLQGQLFLCNQLNPLTTVCQETINKSALLMHSDSHPETKPITKHYYSQSHLGQNHLYPQDRITTYTLIQIL